MLENCYTYSIYRINSFGVLGLILVIFLTPTESCDLFFNLALAQWYDCSSVSERIKKNVGKTNDTRDDKHKTT